MTQQETVGAAACAVGQIQIAAHVSDAYHVNLIQTIRVSDGEFFDHRRVVHVHRQLQIAGDGNVYSRRDVYFVLHGLRLRAEAVHRDGEEHVGAIFIGRRSILEFPRRGVEQHHLSLVGLTADGVGDWIRLGVGGAEKQAPDGVRVAVAAD